jgi:lactate dehydrogenase-like 2-hydroxyacid dehydrogenase
MAKIVVTNPMDFSPEQKSRLDALGDVTFYDDFTSSAEEWVKRCQGYDIVCSWMVGLRENYSRLKDVVISVPFVGVGTFADPKILKDRNITLCNSPGCNRHPVAEWIIYMILTTVRRFDKLLRTTESVSISPPQRGVAGRNITILGKGNVGTRVGEICKALEMNVTYFERGDDLLNAVKNADVIVDTLSTNPSSKGILNKVFFNSVKHGAIFISVTVDAITDFDAMLEALDKGRLSYVAHDVANAKPGDATNPIYLRLREHKNVFATPHIAGFSDMATQIGNDMMIDNVEAWIKGKPIHVFKG